MGFIWGGEDANVLELITVMVPQCCKYTKKQQIIHFKRYYVLMEKLHALKKNKDP